jgi:hypothetical protein
MGSDVTDAIRVQVKDADTGTTLDNVFLGNQGIGRDFVAVTDTSGNGMPELGILSVLKGNDQVRTQVWDAVDATFQTNVWFGKVYQPFKLITMPDINSNGSEEIGDRGGRCRSCDAEHPRTGARLGLDHHALQHLAG